MGKLETPVVAGVGGVAVLAAILSVFGGGNKETPARPETRSTAEHQTETSTAPGFLPNQDGPWRAVCQEYAPYTPSVAQPKRKREVPAVPKNKIDLTTVSRGYKTIRHPSSIEGASEITIKHGTSERKITVHKLLVGDLSSCIPPAKLGKIRFVIATLPDPDKTEMRLEFDRYVAALEAAAALQHYNFTGYWFPWRPRDNSPAPKNEDEVEAQLLREEQPGMLLFRNDHGERLFLFVVGETPTSGINRMQMAQALLYRQELIDCYNAIVTTLGCVAHSSLDRGSASILGPLLIAGPHFSGALTSLREVLQSSVLIPEPNTQIVINSPDASAEKLIEDFQEMCKPDAHCSFRSISISADQKDQVAADYLGSIGYDRKNVAELVEDESGFSNSQLVEDKSSSGSNSGGLSSSPFSLRLTYPRELSAVRSLSDEQSEQVAASGSKFLSLSTSPTSVKLSGGEPLERDRPFIYANDDEVTDVSNALADDIRILRQNDIQAVVITASNPLDRIYLLEYFHDRLPNVRLVVEDADELEINHPQFIDLVGTITISNLPLLPGIVQNSSSQPQHLAFASVAAEEEFLATAMLLGKNPDGDLSQEDGLTVSIVGEEGFHFIPFQESFEQIDTEPKWSLVDKEDKVELFGHGPPQDHERSLVGPAPESEISIQFEQSEQIPRAFIVLSLFVYVFTVIHLVSIAKAEHPIAIVKELQGAKPCTPLWAYGSRTGDPILDSGRVYNLFVLNNQLFLLNLLLVCAAPQLSLLTTGSHILPWLRAGAWVCLFVTGLLVIIYGCECLYRIVKMFPQPDISWGKKVLATIYLAITIWYLLAGANFLILWHSVAQKEWRRILWLDDGISPVVPIAAVLLGWTLWGLVQTRRAKWVTYRKVDPISGGIGRISSGHYDLQSEVEQIHREIEQRAITWPRLAVLFGTVGLTLRWQWPSLRGLEPGPEVDGFLSGLGQFIFPDNFHWWFAIWGGIMLLAAVIFAAYQLFKIWSGLSRLLHRLENTSMKEAFEKLGLDDKVQIKIWDLGKAEMRYSEFFLTVKCLRSIRGTSTASIAEAALNDYEAAEFKHCQARLEQARNLQNALTPGICAAMALLEGSSTVVKDSRLEGELRRYLALRFVAFIRYVLLQMRNLTWFVVYGYFFACLAVKLYPFQGGKSLGDLLGLTFFIVLGMLGVMITGILRNPMLRLLEDKDSNPAGALQVILRLVTVGGVPLLAFLAWQFPWIEQIAFSWLRPLWGAIH